MISDYNGFNMIDTGLLYFYSSYSSKCSIFLDAIQKAFAKCKGNVLKINLTRYQELKRKYNIKGIPEFIIIKNNNIVSRIGGIIDSYSLEKWINNNL